MSGSSSAGAGGGGGRGGAGTAHSKNHPAAPGGEPGGGGGGGNPPPRARGGGGGGGGGTLPQAAERVVGERGIVAARGADQPVLGVVDERVHAVGDEVAVGVVLERRARRPVAGGAGILVEAVDRVGTADREGRVGG